MKLNVKFYEDNCIIPITVDDDCHILIKFADDGCIPIKFGELHEITQVDDYQFYTGDYYVTPQVDSQSLSTANKLMGRDVTINAIPYYDVGNTSNGRTIYIGSEID